MRTDYWQCSNIGLISYLEESGPEGLAAVVCFIRSHFYVGLDMANMR